MKHPHTIRLDFVARANVVPWAGAVLLTLGAIAAVGMSMAFNAANDRKDKIESRLDALPKAKHTSKTIDSKLAAELVAVQRELTIPWTPLLNEIEAAAHDHSSSVAILSVAPESTKHTLHISAEVRQLGDALKFIDRLAQAKDIRYPMLESHERKKDDPDHPIKIKIVAEWRS